MRALLPGPAARSLSIALLLVSLALAAVLAVTPRVAAQSPNFISGNPCVGDPAPTWRSGDTWIMYGNVTVPVGCTLTIEPGAFVKGDPDVHLYVDGSLVAGGQQGTATQFLGNVTAGIPWAGLQFDAGSTGSVTWSSFVRVLVAITAQSSAPAISNNTIVQAGAGVRLDTSNALVADNVIDGQRIGAYGILASSSSSLITRNAVNGTNIGIQVGVSGSPVLSNNRITNISGALALGIYATNLGSVTIAGNTLEGALGANGGPGGSGSAAVGILINDTPSTTITGNSISIFHGGRGGAGANSAVGVGGAGGPGGGAAGIAVGAGTSVLIQSNTIASLAGGRGGDGGSSASLGNGGAGGRGGDAIGVEIFAASNAASFLGNSVTNATGGDGGDGGAASGVGFVTGAGGAGGSGYGLFSLQGMNPDVSSNTIQTLRGGRGGNATLSTGGGKGGPGGEVDGIIALADGSALFHANTIETLTGGSGGNGVTSGGFGGNATALLILGDGNPYNATTATFNQVSSVTGGVGGIGGTLSGDGGSAGGIFALHVNPSLASNAVASLLGGTGGQAFKITNQASGGGMAAGISFLLAPSVTSSLDSVRTVTRGGPGTGLSPPSSYGVGVYFLGSTSVTTQASVTNASISSVGDLDLFVDNYTAVTTLNASFSASKLGVMAAGNLTVRNFLAVSVLWPNNVTPVWGARAVVKDDGVEIFNQTKAFSGSFNWIAVTNRVYVDGPLALWHTTQVSVSYQSYAFAANPRSVNMTASQTQFFTMVDGTAPTSSAVALPRWTATRTFSVVFTSSDGFGVGLANVTLWYRFNGGSWTAFGNTSFTILGIGAFSFAAPSDGLYEFATTAVDKAGNRQQPTPPTANNTWTIVDTSAPSSHMLALPTYETSAAFTVSWAPDAGVTDVANYTIQVNTGSGWVDWLTNTTATSASYTPAVQGPIAFRALARDFAGNREGKGGNDTWTTVDTIAPQVLSRTPTGNLTASPTTIVITFSEPMDTASVEGALQISPSVNATYAWSDGSRTLTITLAQPLSQGTSYTVTVGTGARDLAGNGLAQPSVFTFATPSPAGMSLVDLWPLLLVAVAAAAGIVLFLVRRRGSSSPEAVTEAPAPLASPAAKQEAAIDDVFLLYRRDGILIKHETRRLRPDIDTDILSGMLTAVQQFVKDSFRGDEGEELNEMTVGQMHILIGRGKWLVLAATLTGGDIASMTAQIQACVADMEDHNWDRLEDWDGDMEIAKALGPYLKKLIRGEYAG